ncbi:MAG: hypothetical protein JWP97_689 [Labilithrix sp.]|nr:hypothetical protein [Labilithrix sp.]
MMKPTLAASTGLLGLALLAAGAGCGSDPVKKADDAHDQRIDDQRKAEQSQAETRSDATNDSAEKDRKAAVANGAPSADAKLVEAKRVAQAKAQERADKADAKIRELKAKVSKAGSKAPTSAADSLRTVDTQRAVVQSDLQAFASVPDESFQNAKTRLEANLDTLDDLVSKSDKEVSKLK